MQQSKQGESLKNSSVATCQNHENERANFAIESEFEIFYYCKSCAVRLASQGFDVKPVQESKIFQKNEDN